MLFLATLVAENSEAQFPAIARANKAMAMARKAAEVGLFVQLGMQH